MPSRRGLTLCTCVAKRCAEYFDANTGKMGLLLNDRAYRRHQMAEQARTTAAQKRDLGELAISRQAGFVERYETELADIIGRLDINTSPPPPPPPPQPFTPSEEEIKYRARMKRLVIEHLGIMLGHAEDHHNRVKSLGIVSLLENNLATERNVQDALETCKNAETFVIGSQQTLARSARNPARKDASVILLRQNNKNKLKEITVLTQQIDLLCEKYLQDREIRKVEEVSRGGHYYYQSDIHFNAILAEVSKIITLVLFMVVAGHVILGFSQRATYWLFNMCQYIVQTTALSGGDTIKSLSPYFVGILDGFPKDIRAATAKFQLDAEGEVYAVCPSCHANHRPTYDKNIPKYREKCNSRRYGRRCREIITHPKIVGHAKIHVPIKTYIAFDFQDWLGNLLSRKGYEAMMDDAWNRMEPPQDGSLTDIFQGARIRNFTGPDGKHFSEAGPAKSGRYLFSLGFDFFNPRRNLANGKKVSVGVIALTCLNLPINIRYKPENMFLAGLIAGPKEPDFDHINPYFKPIVEHFLRFWKGVLFSRTSLLQLYRCIFCALIALICDLPAARKAGGFVGCQHERYCSVCNCNRTETPFDNYDYHSWIKRTNDDCRTDAELFRDAFDQKTANRSVDKTGLRYSEFMRLPYYDVTKSVVVDPMHNLFLGLIKEHFQNVLGYGKSNKELSAIATKISPVEINVSPTPTNPVPDKTEVRSSVKTILSWLQKPADLNRPESERSNDMTKRFEKCHVAALVYVGKGLGCLSQDLSSDARLNGKKTKKCVMAAIITQWRFNQPEVVVSSLSQRMGQIISEGDMQEVRKDIQRMVKPSWMASIPTTISSTGPKLKSDEWRVAGSVYLPVSLIRLWSSSDDKDLRDVLNLTMLLFSAIGIITSRVTSPNQASLYLRYMLEYRKELKRLFPNYKCHPNHHMALHIHDFLLEYGPVHGWWTYPFERMIGTLQRISTNYHEGEYEKTIGATWYRRSNLTALFTKIGCPTVIVACKEMFLQLVRPDARDSATIQGDDNDLDIMEVIVDSLTSKTTEMTDQVLVAFRRRLGTNAAFPRSAVFSKRTRANGITYATHMAHAGNSGVLCHGSEVPYRIENILTFDKDNLINGESTWFVIKAHLPVKVKEDPYTTFPYLRAKMWGVDCEESIEVVPLSSIEGHFAKCIVPWENKQVAVCVSLSRTRPV